jgi:hypothetical protein
MLKKFFKFLILFISIYCLNSNSVALAMLSEEETLQNVISSALSQAGGFAGGLGGIIGNFMTAARSAVIDKAAQRVVKKHAPFFEEVKRRTMEAMSPIVRKTNFYANQVAEERDKLDNVASNSTRLVNTSEVFQGARINTGRRKSFTNETINVLRDNPPKSENAPGTLNSLRQRGRKLKQSEVAIANRLYSLPKTKEERQRLQIYTTEAKALANFSISLTPDSYNKLLVALPAKRENNDKNPNSRRNQTIDFPILFDQNVNEQIITVYETLVTDLQNNPSLPAFKYIQTIRLEAQEIV